MTSPSPIYSKNYLRRNRLTGNLRRIRRVMREVGEIQRLVPIIPEDEPGDGTRKAMTLHYLDQADANLIAARNQLTIQRDGINALKKLQDKT